MEIRILHHILFYIFIISHTSYAQSGEFDSTVAGTTETSNGETIIFTKVATTVAPTGGSSEEHDSTRVFVPVTKSTPTKTQRKRGSLGEGKGKKNAYVRNDTEPTREALSHEGSDPVVYLSDSTGYLPITPLRARPSSIYSNDLENWRPDVWDRDYNRRFRFNNTRVQHIEAECQDDYMKIRLGFNGSFSGLLYSSGYAYDPDCMYINGSGRDYYEFYIQLNRCGTLGKNAISDEGRKNPTKNFMWNTVTVQYNPLIEEEFDEHFKVTCEYGYDFWKTVTFPFLDVEVATGNPVIFTLSPPECYMEIRNGYGTSGTRVQGPVRVGDPLTLVIYMRSKYDGFDLVVNDCYAHNGANKKIQLIDEFGCPVDDKLISRFRGTWTENQVYETQVYAYMKTFRFTGSPALYIECDVRMCHGRCPSQPCHWRNLKTKREIRAIADENATLSDNISLFQSLRVVQDEELTDEGKTSIRLHDPNETCMKTSIFSAMAGIMCTLLCILMGILFVLYAKLRHRTNKDQGYFDAYFGHKGQID